MKRDPSQRDAKAPPSPAAALPAEPQAQVLALARRWKGANGPVMALVTRLGGTLETQMAALPAGFRDRVEGITAQALERAYGFAAAGDRLPGGEGRAAMAAVIATGAAGGFAGLAGAMAELPFTITVLLHAIRREAAKAGYDPDDPWIMAEALRAFGSGSPAAADDGIDTGFLAARMTLTGPALQALIARIAPQLATALGQKLFAQSVPVLGALSGAALNAAYLRHYREAAAIRFALLRLAEQHGAAPVLESFTAAIAAPAITRA